MEQVSFKNRNKYKLKPINLKFGNIGLITFKNIQFEYVYFYIIKKFLKYFFKLKYACKNHLKLWVLLKANFPVSKKSKNARMGKGKGSFIRWLIKINQGSSIIEFKKVNYLRVKKFNNYWNKLLNFKNLLIRISK